MGITSSMQTTEVMTGGDEAAQRRPAQPKRWTAGSWAMFVRNATRLIVGAPLLSAQHAWRQRYTERSLVHDTTFSEAPPIPRPRRDGSAPQRRSDGTGPLMMRTYAVDIASPVLSPAELIDELCRNPNGFSPRHVAGFRSFGGDPMMNLSIDDEFVVEIPGPWNGPVRVDAIDASSITLSTLDGHMEAGHIRLAVVDHTPDTMTFQIRSWARAGDELFEAMHVKFPVARELQTAMWSHTCDRAVDVSGGTRRGPLRVDTVVLIDSDDTSGDDTGSR